MMSELEELTFPPTSGTRGRRSRALAGVADLALDLRALSFGIGRALDRGAETRPVRSVLVTGVYGGEGADAMAAAVRRLRDSRHAVRFALGSLGPAEPRLAPETVAERLEGGKFGNLNRIAAVAGTDASDWVLILDDDVGLGRRFLDRLLYLAEVFVLDLAQPSLCRSSHTAWDVTRRRAALVRETRSVEIGPVTLMHRDVHRELAPFPEEGMGWGLDLHWAAVAERLGWRVGVIDAVPVSHASRPAAAGYSRGEAMAAARRFLSDREHLPYHEAARVLRVHDRLP